MSTFSKRHISIAAALALLASSVTNLVASSASAADMLEDQQETTQVEYGTGWYLRGDISATATGNYFSSETSETDVANESQIVQTDEGDTSLGYGIGFGYRFTESLRADLGYRYLGGGESSSIRTGITPIKACDDTWTRRVEINEITGSQTFFFQSGQQVENCTEENSSSYNLQALMANAYYDLETPIWGVKPFVGAGIGVIRNQFTSVLSAVTCTPTAFELCNPTDGGIAETGEQYVQEGDRLNGTSYHLAGSIHAGFAIPIGDNMYVDTAYTYTRMAESSVFGGANSIDATGAPVDFHSLRVGMRIEIW